MTAFNPFGSPALAQDSFDQEPGAAKGTSTTLHGYAFTGQIITLALAKGILIIGLIFGVLLMDDERAFGNAAILLPLGGGLFVVMLAGAFFVSKMLRSAGVTRLRQHPEVHAMHEATPANTTMAVMREEWIQWDNKSPLPLPLRPFLAGEQSATIVGQAMLEGSAVINLVFALLDGSYAHFLFAFLAMVGLVSMIPTTGKLRKRIEIAISPESIEGPRR
ncbi:hypothetical protein [Neorhodopirellula pilleata]|uniref:Uncharacterized protein n=1 Tax=Neorhodopirellula pilleata TaxID=2714738 RepID=A0A5C6AQM3_9BACT|nr:hypothetical protein [Neorhodopirellula pilleata]TWU01519.1 hypothetical protein Pla100_12540 [Neorhodopirellula pilleata]